MKAIEDSFSDVFRKIINKEILLNQDDFQNITDFYILWYLRSYTELKPLKKIKVIDSKDLDDHLNGKYPSYIALSSIMCSISKISFPASINGFNGISGCVHNMNIKKPVIGNQYTYSYRVLRTLPKDDNHKIILNSNIPWNHEKKNQSRNSIIKWNQRESVYYIDRHGYLGSDMVNEMRMRTSLQDYSKRYCNLKWGVITSECGEFIVPINPTHAFMANIENRNINCADIEKINKQSIVAQKYFFCCNLDDVMLFDSICPLKR